MSRVWAVVALAFIIAGCGYALAGKYNNMPAHIKRIGVPTFQNLSPIADLDRLFTEAVKAELRSRGKFTIVSDATGVDAVLTGSILSVAFEPMAFSPTQQASQYSVTVIATGDFKEIKDSKTHPTQSIRAMEPYDLPSGALVTDLASLFIQDRNALERLAKKFADTLVTQILDMY